ncbi:MAG: hypothetical protein UZ14_CFX002001439 [Chloroflexi bacterium OLB14]|nr:MAG: hypothetical protein UZ14_CFX002001439 [Chloroflexi bacterium OLB14]
MLLAYLCLLSSLFLIYLPLFVLWNIKSMTWNEFVFSYPSLRWIKPTHDIVYTIIFIPLIGISFYTSFNQDKFGEDFFLLFTPLVNVISLFHGILAFKTSVYIFFGQRYLQQYWYDEHKTKLWFAELQIFLAIILSLASLLIYFL